MESEKKAINAPTTAVEIDLSMIPPFTEQDFLGAHFQIDWLTTESRCDPLDEGERYPTSEQHACQGRHEAR
jgi:hypothetical protein